MTDSTDESERTGGDSEQPDASASNRPTDIAGNSKTGSSRRRYLGLLGAAAASIAGCSELNSPGEETPQETDEPETATSPQGPSDSQESARRRHGIQFDRVVDAVEDLNLDPTGESPVNDGLTDALKEGTLVQFPEGDYQFEGELPIEADRVGFLGQGDVRFVPLDGYNGTLINYYDPPDDVMIENVDIDMRAAQTTVGVRLACRNRFHIQDVEFLGRGLISADGQVSAFILGISNESGRGILRNAVAKKGSRIDGYAGGNGRIGVWVGWSNKGTVRIEDCDFREFGNNGTYTSRTPGQVEIVDSYFLNNNASNVRIGGEGSYVENCTVEIDMEKYTGPPLGDISTGFNTRGIVVEQGLGKPGPPLPAGAVIRDCTLLARRSPLAKAVIEQGPQARSLTVRNTEITCDIDETPAVRRGPPGRIPYRPEQREPPPPHWTRLENVRIDGTASNGAAIELYGATGSVIEDTTVNVPGARRDGVVLANSPESNIRGGTIRASGYPVVFRVDLEQSLDRRLLCLDPTSVVERLGSAREGKNLTESPALFQVLQREEAENNSCLSLASNIPTELGLDDLSGPLHIGIADLDQGIPQGELLNTT
jgi:hypothetical protein